MTINELLKTLGQGGQLANVYLILGEADYLQRRLKAGFKNSVPAEEQTMNFVSYDKIRSHWQLPWMTRWQRHSLANDASFVSTTRNF